MKQATVLNVRQFIDEQPFSRYQLMVVSLCAAVVFIDGYDAQAMGYVAGSLMREFHVTRPVLGPAISSGLFGMMVGALLCGPLADRFGRKPVLVACTLTFGIGALLTATAASLNSLIVLRVFTGLGMGGAMPNAIALTAEFAPKRGRATAVMAMFCGFSIGAFAVGLVAARMIALYSWRAVFVVGGIIPCILTFVLAAALPESLRFLLLNGKDPNRVARCLRRIAPSGPAFHEMFLTIEEPKSSAFAVTQLFSDKRAVVTLLLWVMFFMNLLDLYFLNAWLPTMMSDVGIAETRAILITSLLQLGGTVAALTLGRLFDRAGSFRTLSLTYLGAAVAVLLIGVAGASIPLLICAVFAAGFCVIGGQGGSNALASEFYPTAIRSTGVGWALGIGRIGSIIGPTLGGYLLAGGGGTRRVFAAAALPPLVAMMAAAAASFVRPKETSCHNV